MLAFGLALAAATSVQAAPAGEPPVKLQLDYKLDVVAPIAGAPRAGRHLDGIDVGVDADLQRLVGWRGGVLHLDLLNTSGDAPGEDLGALQGVDSLEVAARRPRLFQAWVEQDWARFRLNLRAGLSDLSGEFATADASGVLINPAFGMAPDFSASGASAFPSTALGARLRWQAAERGYVQVAAVNARAGVPGEPGGVDTSFDDGGLLIAEAAWTVRGKVAVGAWGLTRRQDDLSAVDAAGEPRGRKARGAYVVVNQPLIEGGETGRTLTGFLRGGISDGRTTPFKGSVQAGLLVEPAIAARPDSSLTLGVTQARLGDSYRRAAQSAGGDPGRAETLAELAYSDMLTPAVRLQPDLQLIHRPGGERSAKTAVVAALRLNVAF